MTNLPRLTPLRRQPRLHVAAKPLEIALKIVKHGQFESYSQGIRTLVIKHERLLRSLPISFQSPWQRCKPFNCMIAGEQLEESTPLDTPLVLTRSNTWR